MINQLRTLLLNRNGNETPGATYPGEQYVPPAYRQRRLPPRLQAVYNQLFGTSPDRALLNYRLQELLTCVHLSEYADYATALDPRITYWPFNTSLFEKATLGATAQKLVAASGQELYFVGERVTTESVNRIYFQWRLYVQDGDTVILTQYDDNSAAVQTTSVEYTLDGGVSSLISLPGSQLQVRFGAGTGAAWLIEVLARPDRTLVQVAEGVERSLGDGTALWAPDSPEPYKTFRNLWNLHDQLPYRLAGLTLALGYRLNELAG